MNRSSSSRARKQNFSPNNSSNFFRYNDDIDSENESQSFNEDESPPRRPSRTPSSVRKISDPRDRQSQLDHNEQERGRRRELAIIYEMIRTCITEEDIRRHLDGAAKSADKLSYPQLLQISCGKIRDELHDQKVIRNLFRDIEALENLCDDLGISFEKKRPAVHPMERHKIIADVVEDVLSIDKRSRNGNGDYVMSQRARAQIAHDRLKDLLVDVNKLVGVSHSHSYHPSLPLPRDTRPIGPIRRPIRRIPRSRRSVYERRPNVVSPVSSPLPPPITSPELSSVEGSILSREDIERVIGQFPLPSPTPLGPESYHSMIQSNEIQDIGDRMLGDNVDGRFDELISGEEAATLLREFDVNSIEDLGFDSLFGLVNTEDLEHNINNFYPFP